MQLLTQLYIELNKNNSETEMPFFIRMQYTDCAAVQITSELVQRPLTSARCQRDAWFIPFFYKI